MPTKEAPDYEEPEDPILEDAVEWFNNLDVSVKRRLILSHYTTHMSLKDIKTKKLLLENNNKWKSILSENQTEIKMLEFEKESLASINTMALNNGSGEYSALLGHLNEHHNTFIKEIMKLDAKLESKLKSQKSTEILKIDNYYSHIESLLGNTKGHLLKLLDRNSEK